MQTYAVLTSGRKRSLGHSAVVSLVAAVLLVVTACSSSDSKSSSTTTGETSTGGGAIDRAHIDDALAKLRTRITETMTKTGVPGVALGVVFDDKVVTTEGFGVRKLGQPEKVDADTVFQLASVSKSLGSSVMASLVGQGKFGWDDPVRTSDPSFALANDYVSENATYADLYSHRSGLPEHAGDLLEDIGFSAADVISRLRLYPLDAFRSSYHYTNFGMTAAGDAGAKKARMTWEEASKTEIYDPLGMSSTSSTYADFESRTDKAAGHVEVDTGKWQVTPQQRTPDAQSPAGGASSSVNDMVKWLRMELGEGKFEGKQIVDTKALAQTWLPHAIANPPKGPTAHAGFYGLGYNVDYDANGRLKLAHSGAFALGAATTITMYPADKIGVVVLTNAAPIGVSEAIGQSFFDDLFNGKQSQDWLALYGKAIREQLNPPPEKDFAHPPANAKPAGAADAYVGTYSSPLYGTLDVATSPSGGLQMTIGPAKQTYEIHPYDGDEMWWQFRGENAGPPAAVRFTVGGGKASSVELANFDIGLTDVKLGLFTRS